MQDTTCNFFVQQCCDEWRSSTTSCSTQIFLTNPLRTMAGKKEPQITQHINQKLIFNNCLCGFGWIKNCTIISVCIFTPVKRSVRGESDWSFWWSYIQTGFHYEWAQEISYIQACFRGRQRSKLIFSTVSSIARFDAEYTSPKTSVNFKLFSRKARQRI